MPAIRVISSASGLEATRLAYQLIEAGEDVLSGVVEGVTLVEDDPDELTVGYGGLPNEQGFVELDAAVMHGSTHRVGGVAALKNVRHAARLAKLVLEQTDHSLIVGQGANDFARAQGFPEENLLTEKARKIWLYWKQTNSNRDDWIPPPPDLLDQDVKDFFKLVDDHGPAATHNYQRSEAIDRPTGTIHCSGIDANGDISCVTTTSGLAFKIPGRVGDSALIGAGLYVDNEVGAAGATGIGENVMRYCATFMIVEFMRQGMTPEDACLAMIDRILKKEKSKKNPSINFVALDRKGRYGGAGTNKGFKFAVTSTASSEVLPNSAWSKIDFGSTDGG